MHLLPSIVISTSSDADEPPPPAVDYTLKGTMNLPLPAGHTTKARETTRGVSSDISPSGFLPPPPSSSGGGRRPTPAVAAVVADTVSNPENWAEFPSLE